MVIKTSEIWTWIEGGWRIETLMRPELRMTNLYFFNTWRISFLYPASRASGLMIARVTSIGNKALLTRTMVAGLLLTPTRAERVKMPRGLAGPLRFARSASRERAQGSFGRPRESWRRSWFLELTQHIPTVTIQRARKIARSMSTVSPPQSPTLPRSPPIRCPRARFKSQSVPRPAPPAPFPFPRLERSKIRKAASDRRIRGPGAESGSESVSRSESCSRKILRPRRWSCALNVQFPMSVCLSNEQRGLDDFRDGVTDFSQLFPPCGPCHNLEPQTARHCTALLCHCHSFHSQT